MGRVVVIGSYNTDIILETGHIPMPGETTMGAGLRKARGGKGANQAVASARMGAQTAFVGNIGRDTNGDEALELLKKEGIDVSRVRRHKRLPSGVAVVMVARNGQNAIVVAPGSNMAVSPSDIDKIKFKTSDVLVLQLEIPLNTVSRAIEKGAKAGATVALNPAPAAKIPRKILRRVDWIIPNEREAAFLAGMDVNGLKQVREAARKLLEMGPRNCIITLGKRGVFIKSGKMEKRIGGHKVKTVDTTAAGDAFVGAFAARLSGGDAPLDAIEWAQAAAAIATTRLGASPSLPKRDEAAAFMKQSDKGN